MAARPDACRHEVRRRSSAREGTSPRDCLRRGEVSEHRRMLECGNRDVDVDGRGLHACMSLLLGGHRQSRAECVQPADVRDQRWRPVSLHDSPVYGRHHQPGGGGHRPMKTTFSAAALAVLLATTNVRRLNFSCSPCSPSSPSSSPSSEISSSGTTGDSSSPSTSVPSASTSKIRLSARAVCIR